MNELIARIRQDIQQDSYYPQNFGTEAEWFLAWYLRHILLRSPSQAREDITDGPDDCQIDAVVVDDVHRQVRIIQAKFFAAPLVEQEPLLEVLAGWLHLQGLPAVPENANPRVQARVAVAAGALEQGYELILELLTTGELTPAARADWDSIWDKIKFARPARLSLVGAAAIMAHWQCAPTLPEGDGSTHQLALEPGKYLWLPMGGFQTLVAAVKLQEVLRLPGLADQSLFRPNVREALRATARTNKAIKQTLQNGQAPLFYLYHNGLTALCTKMTLDGVTKVLSLEGLCLVNGCQTANTLAACAAEAQQANGAYVLFRFFEVPPGDVADRISIHTNSQTAVRPRDLLICDDRLKTIKAAYEQCYPQGFLALHDGQQRPVDREERQSLTIERLAQLTVAWQGQRPNLAGNESRLFDEYFDLLFPRDYPPVSVQVLHQWLTHLERRWSDASLGLPDKLREFPDPAKFHLLYTVQACFALASNQADRVPLPAATQPALREPDAISDLAANCLKAAFESAETEARDKAKPFNPQNWLKSKDCLGKIQTSLRMYLGMLATLPGGRELKQRLVLEAAQFAPRWEAD